MIILATNIDRKSKKSHPIDLPYPLDSRTEKKEEKSAQVNVTRSLKSCGFGRWERILRKGLDAN